VAVKIGSSTRNHYVSKSISEMPGPGNYNDNNKFGKNTVSFYMGERVKDINKNANPGPGSYEDNRYVIKERV
jgi:hypothetical protein